MWVSVCRRVRLLALVGRGEKIETGIKTPERVLEIRNRGSVPDS